MTPEGRPGPVGPGSAAGPGGPALRLIAEWVAAHREDPNVRLVEVDVNTNAYDEGHIPGAVGWNWRA